MTQPTENTPPKRASLPLLVIMGTIYWFVAALVVRSTAADWVGSTAATLIVFALILVVTPAALLLGMRVAGAARRGGRRAIRRRS